jgi:ssDNA thymidine ADP-ribosyltransferase, DarT
VPISIARARQHIKYWEDKLAPFSSRKFWPKHLFHTCQMEVAERIIRDGYLNCRDDVPHLICDVANQGALWNNADAHAFSRLYFRPKNSFHLKTEGIKSKTDIYRQDPHMALPVTFAFDFAQIITLPNSYFLPENFALTGSTPLSGDDNFNTLNFDNIYHDGATTEINRQTIHRARMAEVVVAGAIPLQHVNAIVCRTIHEERTLKYRLRHFTRIAPRIVVERTIGGVFQRKGIFIDDIFSKGGVLHLNFHGPESSRKQSYEVCATCGTKKWIGDLAPGNWRFASLPVDSPGEFWKVEIEGCIAYEAPIVAQDNQVV